jgi:hypothetical protein
VSLPDVIEVAASALFLGGWFAVLAVAAGISEVLDRFDRDADGREDAA